MAIRKIPNEPTIATQKEMEKKVEEFVNGGDIELTKPKKKKIVVNLKFDDWLLEEIDRAASCRGISRTAWISNNLSEILKRGIE